MKKIIAILFALIAIAIMKILESHIAIKHFIMGGTTLLIQLDDIIK